MDFLEVISVEEFCEAVFLGMEKMELSYLMGGARGQGEFLSLLIYEELQKVRVLEIV